MYSYSYVQGMRNEAEAMEHEDLIPVSTKPRTEVEYTSKIWLFSNTFFKIRYFYNIHRPALPSVSITAIVITIISHSYM